MICLAYLSSATNAVAADKLDAILAASQRNNRARSVTGMLRHFDGSFLRFLKGEPEDVDAIYERIAADPRHQGVIQLYRREIDERLFPDWSMALARIDAVEPEQRAFCKGLRELETATTQAHRELIEPFVSSCRAWMR